MDFLKVVNTIAVTGVELNASAKSLTEGETFQLTATVKPDGATNKTVTWSSSDTSIVSVDATGLVTAKAVGTATVTVTTQDGNKTASCAITVNPVSVTAVNLDVSSQSLIIYETFQLTATVKPDNAANKAVTWSSSDAKIASVNSSGLVTANGVGTATITVTTADGNKTASCAVSVSAPPIPTDGLVAYFPFNGNANDMSGNGNHGTVHGATLTSDRFGKANSAYYFNGVNASIDGGLKVGISGEFTVSLWVNSASAPQGNNNGVISELTGDGMTANILNQNDERGGVILWAAIGGAGGRGGYSLNTWYHTVQICRFGYRDNVYYVTNLYIDNQEVEAFVTSKSSGPYNGFSFGKSKINRYEYYVPFNGLVDDVRIYNRALSESEISALYLEGSSGTRSVEIENSVIAPTEENIQSKVQAYISNGWLQINSPAAEQITIYSLSGSIVHQSDKAAGQARFDVSGLPKGVYVVRGGTGWARKVVK